MMAKQYWIVFYLFFSCLILRAQSDDRFVSENFSSGYLALITDGEPLPLRVDSNDYKGVLRAVKTLQGDFERVSGKEAEVVTTAKSAIWIGTVGQSNLIDGLIAQGRLHKNARSEEHTSELSHVKS